MRWMRRRSQVLRDERGFTMTEMLTTLFVFSIASIGFYQVMFSGMRGSDTARSVVRVSEEARLAFNRMIRDAREAETLVAASGTSFQIRLDFNADGAFENPNAVGDYEDLTYSYSGNSLFLNGERLATGVKCIKVGSGACKNTIFDYASSHLEYDWDGNGVTTWQELDKAPSFGVIGVGNNNNVLDAGELDYISEIKFAFSVTNDSRMSEFYSHAQMRNRR